MSDTRPLLTVAIPTYNRAGKLRRLLDGLIPQTRDESRVELIVSDNCSADDTEAQMQLLIEGGAPIQYLRNPQNIGPDLNFLQCYERAQGMYLWIIGDDDFIFPGTLAKVLSELEEGTVDIVYIAPFGFVAEPDERRLANPAASTHRIAEVQSFVHRVGLYGDLALITGIIVNKSSVDASPHPPFALALNTNLIQLSWIFCALRCFRSGIVFERGLLSVCEENPSRPFDIAQVFGVNWHKVAVTFLEPRSTALNAVLDDQLYSWFPTNWFAQRKTSRRTQTAPPQQLLTPLYGDRLLYWLCVYPLLVLPSILAAPWLALLRTVRHIDRILHRPSA